MKKIALLALIAFMMVGCGKKVAYKNDGVSISIIDSCEYIKSYTYGISAYTYSHKGNCKFCAERRKKELDSLAIKIWEGFE